MEVSLRNDRFIEDEKYVAIFFSPTDIDYKPHLFFLQTIIMTVLFLMQISALINRSEQHTVVIREGIKIVLHRKSANLKSMTKEKVGKTLLLLGVISPPPLSVYHIDQRSDYFFP